MKRCRLDSWWPMKACLVVALGLFMGLQALHPALGQDRPGVVMTLDASGAMARKVDGVSAMVAVGSALAGNFVTFEERLDMAVVAFGNSEPSACATPRLVKEMAPLKAAQYGTQVAILDPRGGAPVAQSLQVAADHAASLAAKPDILMVAGSPDTCGGDPCATARGLKKQYPWLRAHVVAFAIPQGQNLDSLRCVAGVTGGVFRVASAEDELSASIAALMSAIEDGKPSGNGADGPDGWETSAVAPGGGEGIWSSEARPAEADEGGARETQTTVVTRDAGTGDAKQGELQLAALLTNNSDTIPSGLAWHLFEAERGPDGKHRHVTTVRGSAPRLKVAKGDYLVTATYGRAHLTKRIKISPDSPKRETFVLNAGGLRIQGRWPDGTALPNRQVVYDILSEDVDQFGRRELILGGARAGAVIRLNAGIYHLRSTYGDANAIVEADVTVEAGKLTNATINFSAARATFKLVQQAGGEAVAGTRWQIRNESGQTVKESVGALPTHILAAGRYRVLAFRGEAQYSRDFSIKPGDVRQVEVLIE